MIERAVGKDQVVIIDLPFHAKAPDADPISISYHLYGTHKDDKMGSANLTYQCGKIPWLERSISRREPGSPCRCPLSSVNALIDDARPHFDRPIIWPWELGRRLQ